MKTLVVASLAPCDPGFLADLAAGCDLIVAADGGGAACLAAGIVPDLIVGDLDSLATRDETRLRQAGTRFVTFPAEKDVTDLDLALDEAKAAGTTEVLLTGVLGERLDHTLASLGALVRHAALRPAVVETDMRAWVLSSGGRSSLNLVGLDAVVSLFALGAPATVTCRGMRYALSAEVLGPLDSRGLSNVITADNAAVEVHDGVLVALSVLTSGTLLARERVSSLNTE